MTQTTRPRFRRWTRWGIPSSLLQGLEFVIPNGVCEVRNLSFLGILIEEEFLVSLGMAAKPIFQQPALEQTGFGLGGAATPDGPRRSGDGG